MERALPQSLEGEKITLGCILLDERLYLDAAAVLQPDDFSLEKHRRIFRRMGELAGRGEHIDRVTLYGELQRHGEAESCDGISYLSDLTEGVPVMPHIDSYLRLVKDKATLRRLMFACQHLSNRAMCGEESVQEILGGATKAIFELTDGAEVSGGAEDVAGILAECGGISGFLGAKRGVPTPWAKLDYYTGGWQNGGLILVAARPSRGKTALAVNAIWHAAAHGIPSVFYTYEMGKPEILMRFVSLLTRIPYLDLIRGNLNPSERRAIADALEEIRSKPLAIVGASGKTALALRIHMERMKRRGKLAFAAVDYIGLIHGGAAAMQNRNQELGETCRILKEAAGELQIPLLVLSQLNRAPEMRTDKRPVMADIRDSGELENHADLIAFIHLPGYYRREDPNLRLLAELIIAKQRNGDTPILSLNFRREFGRFESPEEELQEECA